MSLWEKIFAVQASIEKQKKEGSGTGIKYKFFTDVQATELIREKAQEQGLVITTSTIDSEVGTFEYQSWNCYEKCNVTKTARYAKVTTEHDIIDTTNGGKFTARSQGYAEDSGDKPLTKAITSSTKYFMMKFFMIPTGDDIENEHIETTGVVDPKGEENHRQYNREKKYNPAGTSNANPPAEQDNYSADKKALADEIKKLYALLGISNKQLGSLLACNVPAHLPRETKEKLTIWRDYCKDLLARRDAGKLNDSEWEALKQKDTAA